jgi:hypothetical protein
MKKTLLVICFAFLIAILTQCSSSKKATAQKITYTNNIQPILVTKCTPCHFPDKGGRIKALNTYAAVKDEADEIIRRIELHPGEKGFMPFKHPRLSEDTISVFKQWRDGGLTE